MNSSSIHESLQKSKVIYSNIGTVYSGNNTDNINNLNYVVTQSESK
jgi:hypothetical protein